MRLQKVSEIRYLSEEGCKDNDKIKVGEWVTVEKSKKERSLPQLRQMWAVANNVMHQKCDRVTPENEKAVTYDMVKRCMIANGHCISYETGGKVYKTAHSLKMSNKKLTNELANEIVSALYVLWAKWVQVSVEELTNSVSDIQ